MNNIRIYRQKLNISQEKLAQRLNVDRSTISKWESGDVNPRVETLLKLAALFNCTVDELIR